ncbi:MAG TPA: sodium:proton antiporter [Ktedonobacteraceae bacterium]|jgi:CPA1 family monovalent cation:H+ antiporter|nr:sodium:proton antiporter [Ktedonobacteraceae bacterium]
MTNITSIVRLLELLLLIALIVILATRRLRIPYTLGLVVVGLAASLSGFFPGVHLTPDLVLFVFLPALLFEGAWSIETKHLRQNWFHIFLLVGPGLLICVVSIALPLHFFAGINWLTAFLLGAILSPTDPVAVLGLLRQSKVDVNLSSIIEGESLLNDGVAGALYSIFLSLILLSMQGQSPAGFQPWLNSFLLFLLEAGDGTLIGLAGGFIVSRLVRLIDEPLIETTITIVTAYGIYLLADTLHTSGILAVIFAALLLGSYGRRTGMAEHTLEAVDNFWSVIAFIANALVFLLVGAELNPARFLSSTSLSSLLITAGITVVAVLLSRLIVVLMLPWLTQPLIPPTLWSFLPASWRVVIFWSGLRGALSLALVLALPLNIPSHDSLVASTYAVVFFTLLVQGFTLRFVLKGPPSVSK